MKKSQFHKNQANRKVRRTPIDKDIFQSKGKGYIYNGTIHMFTLDKDEVNNLVKLGWMNEGVAFHSGDGKEVYRVYNPNNGDHLFTTNKTEVDTCLRQGYLKESSKIKTA